jgi:hypothetical protein
MVLLAKPPSEYKNPKGLNIHKKSAQVIQNTKPAR